MPAITFDGYQLAFPGTGLALVTCELLKAFNKLGYGSAISVFVPQQFDAAEYGLEALNCHWIATKTNATIGADWLARALTVPDYADRARWARAVEVLQRSQAPSACHFIPYFFNYGKLEENVVLIPDLLWKLNPSPMPIAKSWLHALRYRLPLRHLLGSQEEQHVCRARNFVVYSKFVKSHAQEELCIAPEQMLLAPLAAPEWVSLPLETHQIETLRTHLGLPERYTLYVGGLSHRKNIPLLLRACGKVHAQDSSFRCVIVGLDESYLRGPFGDALCQLMTNSDVAAAVIGVPHQSYVNLAALYRYSEFTVYPSLGEGFGMPILEAAAVGKLCLCGDNTSMIEIQKRPEYRIDSQNERAWSERMLYYWQHPEKARIAGEECRLCSQDYSWCRSAEQIWQLLTI